MEFPLDEINFRLSELCHANPAANFLWQRAGNSLLIGRKGVEE
jgi:hypothetical protein